WEKIEPSERWQDAVGEVRQQIHAGRVNIPFRGDPDDVGGRGSNPVKGRYLVVVQIAHGEDSDREREGDQQECGRERTWRRPGVRLRLHDDSCLPLSVKVS